MTRVLEGLALLVPLAAGMGVGWVYFHGLWLTVRHLHRFRRPGLALLSSFTLRVLVATAVFVLLLTEGWAWLVAALVGFLIVRGIAIRLARRETGHMPAPGETGGTTWT